MGVAVSDHDLWQLIGRFVVGALFALVVVVAGMERRKR